MSLFQVPGQLVAGWECLGAMLAGKTASLHFESCLEYFTTLDFDFKFCLDTTACRFVSPVASPSQVIVILIRRF